MAFTIPAQVREANHEGAAAARGQVKAKRRVAAAACGNARGNVDASREDNAAACGSGSVEGRYVWCVCTYAWQVGRYGSCLKVCVAQMIAYSLPSTRPAHANSSVQFPCCQFMRLEYTLNISASIPIHPHTPVQCVGRRPLRGKAPQDGGGCSGSRWLACAYERRI